MTDAQLDALATQAGARDTALPDIRARLAGHFADTAPSPQAVQLWLESTLKQAAPHLFAEQTVWGKLGLTQEAFYAMPAAWRLTQGRAAQPPVDRRATPRKWTAEEGRAALTLNPVDRLTMGHAGPPKE